MNEVVFTPIMFRHRRERLPIDAFFVYAKAAPFRFVLKNLMGQLIDAGTGLARTGVTGDEPAPAELIPFPSQAAELRDMGCSDS